MTDVAISARVTGRVQGVAYRGWTKSQAERHGLTGWVRNEDDGSVRALLMGPAPGVAGMLRLMARGPAAARVTDIQSGKAAPDPGVSGFRITG